MELTKLFDAQKKLRDHINYNGEDRFEKLVLALLVEIGECANEWRGFKFWSKDQEPRKVERIKCPICKGSGMVSLGEGIRGVKKCPDCDNPRGGLKTVYPLLEEYVDGLHFVLELGIEMDIQPTHLPGMYPSSITIQFIEIQYMVSELMFNAQQFGIHDKMVTDSYQQIFDYYLFLGRSLGYSPEQMINAYFEKNQINHARQESGY